MSQRLEAFTLFSSSKGNSALFRYGQECVLIDAGVSARALNASLQALGTSLYEIRAIFVTHEHSDHIKGLETISKAFSIPIYAPYLCCRAIRAKCPSAAGLLCSLDGPIELGPFLMQPFPTPHDAEDSVCYRVEAGHRRRRLRDRHRPPHRRNRPLHPRLRRGRPRKQPRYRYAQKRRLPAAAEKADSRRVRAPLQPAPAQAALPRLVESGVRRIRARAPFARKTTAPRSRTAKAAARWRPDRIHVAGESGLGRRVAGRRVALRAGAGFVSAFADVR